MTTVAFTCGAECASLATHWTDQGGGSVAPVKQSVYKHSGTNAWRVTTTAQTSYYSLPATGFTTMLVAHWWLYFVTLPGATTPIQSVAIHNSMDGKLFFNATSGKLAIGATSGYANGNVTVATGQWYRIDARFNVAANPWIIDWQIDGVDQGRYSPAFASDTASTQGSFALGSSTSQTCDVAIDDIVVSSVSGDYPISDGVVTGSAPEVWTPTITLKVRRSSAWTAGAVKVRRSSAWVAPTAVKVRRSGAWTTVT
jgi:hypothetical protein